MEKKRKAEAKRAKRRSQKDGTPVSPFSTLRPVQSDDGPDEE